MAGTNQESAECATGGDLPISAENPKTDEAFTSGAIYTWVIYRPDQPALSAQTDPSDTFRLQGLYVEKKDEAFTSEWIKTYFAKALGIYYGPTPEQRLDEVSFEGMARYIKSDKCQKIVTMVGAGISTSAGLPDFRTPGSGMYTKLEKYKLDRPEQAFDINFFKENPAPYYDIRRDMFAASVKPTPCHYFVKLLEDKGKLLRHFTQNIDGLERDVGISEDRLVEAHGSYRTSHCMICKKQFNRDWCIDKMFDKTSESHVPHCDEKDCNGVIKPDVVFFGESLPKRFAERICDLDDCDFLLIMGTSLVVQPFNTITNRTKENTPRLYINMENKVGGKRHPISVLFFGGGFDFDQEDNIRDVYWEGTCDAGCYELADLIGWGDELREIVKKEHARIDEEWRLAGKIPKVSNTAKTPTGQTRTKTVKESKLATPTKLNNVCKGTVPDKMSKTLTQRVPAARESKTVSTKHTVTSETNDNLRSLRRPSSTSTESNRSTTKNRNPLKKK